MAGFNQIPIASVTYDGNTIAVKGEVTITVEAEFEDATSNNLGSATVQDSYLIGQNVDVTVNASEVDFDVLSALMPLGSDVDGDQTAIGFGSTGCVNAQDLGKALIITPKCGATAPIVSITCHKAMVKDSFDWTLSEAHESIEIPFTLYPDLTQTTPGTYDKEGEMFFRVDIA